MKFNEIVVVEGLHDLERLKSIYEDIDVLITNGSEIEENLPTIIEASNKRDIILFLDPDYPGERIRKKITEVIPNAKHAFLKKDLAISKNKKKVGIEHAKKEDIIDALNNVLTPSKSTKNVTYLELYNLGLFGTNNSQNLRNKVCEKLNLGHTNGKTFLKRINMFNIDIKTIENALK